MRGGFVKIEYRDRVFDVRVKDVVTLSNMGLDLNEQYFDSLVKYGFVDGNGVCRDVGVLLACDAYYLRNMFADNFGWIVRYDADGSVIGVFRSYAEIAEMLKTHQALYTYGFDASDECVIPTRSGVRFFGKVIRPQFDQKCCGLMLQSFLNGVIAETVHDCHGENCLYYAFRLRMNVIERARVSDKYVRRHREISADDFDAVLTCLLDRYGRFVQVLDLNAVRIKSGIYVLVLNDVKGVYIGQSRVGVSKRICSHFITPKSDFDRRFGPSDVSKIYIMECDESVLDRVEQDCIACVGSEIALNNLSGGSWSESVCIGSRMYDEQVFLMSGNELEQCLKLCGNM